ncbi:UAP56-interacting factor isoform X2 [Spea bombifrons]|uniref:UAP56-interacting factor isoform X2 n=1 Tax=Spea bombifrons TaxID=233779 RepID=UPI00234968CA|nr:UAP56-interacting factor isoform X2 [Spea bombifrons]
MVPHKQSVSDNMDKIDMSLDDIIKLNKQEQKKMLFNGRSQTSQYQQFRNNRGRWGAQRYSGSNTVSQGLKRHTYGVKTGLAMRKMASWKGLGSMSRLPLSNSLGQRLPVRRRLNHLRPLDYENKPVSSLQRSGFRVNHQRETRQATFFFSRGLKVQTEMERDQPALNSTHPWRTSTNSGGILTVSIDNPTAIPLPSSLGTRQLRPQLPFLMKKEGAETKIPKGVPLDFDINSVAKQTGITLNERFKILKEQRLSQALGKGSRFVTVG